MIDVSNIVETLIYYDGPILYLALDENTGKHYLVTYTDTYADIHEEMAVEVYKDELDTYKNVELRSFIKSRKEATFIYYRLMKKTPPSQRTVPIKKVKDRCLPEKGAIINDNK